MCSLFLQLQLRTLDLFLAWQTFLLTVSYSFPLFQPLRFQSSEFNSRGFELNCVGWFLLSLFTVLKRPPGRNEPLQYVLILIPPLIMALLDPEIFFKALDFAGTYGGIAANYTQFGRLLKFGDFFSQRIDGSL